MDIKEPLTDWGGVCTDVLLGIFIKLDMTSLFNCMLVNENWRNNAEYLCNLGQKWDKVVDGATNWKTSVFKDKSNLDDEGIVKSAWSWHYVKYATPSLNHRYELKRLRGISIYKDNLIVASSKGVEYYNIHTYQLIKTVEMKSAKHYIETSSLIVKHNSIKPNLLSDNIFTIINKLHFSKCNCLKPRKRIIYDAIYWRVDNDSCYVWNKEHVLHRYRAEKCKWDVDTLAYYEHSPDFVCGMNVHRERTFLFIKKDPASQSSFCSLKEIYRLPITLRDSMQPRMFNTFTVLCAVAPENQLHIVVESVGGHIVVTCPGLSSATEHGHMLILGYIDGKIQIFRKADLYRRIMNPEVQFYLRDYSPSPSYKIIAIDVYEARNCHHLFVATECIIYEFYIKDDNMANTETTDTTNGDTTNKANTKTTGTVSTKTTSSAYTKTATTCTKTTDTTCTKTTDTTCTKTTDTANSEPTDTANTKTTTSTHTKTTDIANTETTDTANTETTDTANTETIDTANTETIDTANTETIDTANTETTDTANTETIDTANTETIDTANTETIDTAISEITGTANREITNTDNIKTTDTDNTEQNV